MTVQTVSRGWAKASACCFHICLSGAILCRIKKHRHVFSLVTVMDRPKQVFQVLTKVSNTDTIRVFSMLFQAL